VWVSGLCNCSSCLWRWSRWVNRDEAWFIATARFWILTKAAKVSNRNSPKLICEADLLFHLGDLLIFNEEEFDSGEVRQLCIHYGSIGYVMAHEHVAVCSAL